jgi:hypothetical protein
MSDPERPTAPDTERVSHVPSSRRKGPPGSFSRIFLGGLEKYRKLTGSRDLESPVEEAAAHLAQERIPPAQRAAANVVRLRSPRAAIETLLITIALPFLGHTIARDPLFLSGFPWLVLAPLLIGLRHGFAFGMASAVMLDGAIAVAWRTQVVTMAHFPGEMFIALLGFAMLSGQFSDVWKREIVRVDAGSKQLRRQMNELARSHFLLELSHDRLEHQTAGGIPTLRQALGAARKLAATGKEVAADALGEAMMDVFSSYCMVEVATLYGVERGVPTRAIASIGVPNPVAPDDPLLAHALATRRLTYVPAITLEEREGAPASPLLLALPLVDLRGILHAVLCVQAIPFFSFEQKNLETLALLAGHFADLLGSDGRATDLERGQRKQFEIRLARAVRDSEEFGVPNAVATLAISHGSPVGDIVDIILGGALEELDFPFVLRDKEGNPYVFVLLPATEEDGARALQARIDTIVRRELHMTLAGAGVTFNVYRLCTRDHLVAVRRLLGEGHRSR